MLVVVDSTAIYWPGRALFFFSILLHVRQFLSRAEAFLVAFTNEAAGVCESSRLMDFMQDAACFREITTPASLMLPVH